MKISETLMRAQALISDPAHWVKHYFACTVKGLPIGSGQPNAYSFCMLGATRRVSNHDDAPEMFLERLSCYDTANFNDSATHAEVMMALDFAILAAKDEGL